ATPQPHAILAPGYSGRITGSTIRQGATRMSHDLILTEDDAPTGNTHAEDILELSMLTLDPTSTPVDISWEKNPQES
ncbi:hypothetical protein, partial [Paenarthrobacter nicotinovorans]